MKWLFQEVRPADVESELTQREDFDNDDSGLGDTLVREAIQNTVDALGGNAKKVRIAFRHVDGSDGVDGEYLRSLFSGMEQHYAAAGFPFTMDHADPTLLLIEDFGTTGLLGAWDKRDDKNWTDFWRRHGKSHKVGGKTGRRGLGKLVYSSSSQLRTFFGLTVRADESQPLLMGQAVLDTRRIGGKEYVPWSFFAEEGADGFQLPVRDPEAIREFCNRLCVSRDTQPGLSLVIPYPKADLTKQGMLTAAVVNYFYPVLTGQLDIEIDGEKVDDSNILHLCKKYGASKIKDFEWLFDFIQASYTTPEAHLVSVAPSWVDEGELGEGAFTADELDTMRKRFSAGELIGVRVPIVIRKIDGSSWTSHFKLFLQRPHAITVGQDLYVRGGITIPREAKFNQRRALGLLIATEEAVSGFLGDAENPAHTKWNSKAEKLKPYKNAYETLKLIRNSLVNLHDLLALVLEDVHEDLLRDFFSAPGSSKTKPKGPRTPPPPTIDIPVKPRAIRIASRKGGFSIKPASEIPLDKIPLEASVEVAYDVVAGNPFTRYDPIDFVLDSMTVKAKGATITQAKENRLAFEINGPEFDIEVSGFDEHRDLVVRAQTGDI
jgi:hypothetical protein